MWQPIDNDILYLFGQTLQTAFFSQHCDPDHQLHQMPKQHQNTSIMNIIVILFVLLYLLLLLTQLDYIKVFI